MTIGGHGGFKDAGLRENPFELKCERVLRTYNLHKLRQHPFADVGGFELKTGNWFLAESRVASERNPTA